MKVNENAKKIAESMYLTKQNVIVTSSEKGMGKDALLDKIERVIQIEKEKTTVPEDAVEE